MKSDLTIILLLKERQEYTERFLKYFEKNNKNFKLFIADGSKLNLGSKILKNIKKNPFITYKKFKEDKNYKIYYQKKLSSLKIVKSKYVLFTSNDDFLIYPTLNKCTKILKENKNLNGAGGTIYSFSLAKNNLNINKIAPLYSNYNYMQKSIKERINFYLENFRYTDNYILNRKNLISSYEIASKNFENNIELKDNLTDLLNIINGKIKIIKSPILFHQSTPQSDAANRPSVFLKHLKERNFPKDLIKLIKIISSKSGVEEMYLFEKYYNSEFIPIVKNLSLKREASLKEIFSTMNKKISRKIFLKEKKEKKYKYSNEVCKIRDSINDFLKNSN